MLNFAEHCRDLTGAGVVVDVPCELQRKLQQFPVGMVKLCRKQPSFHRCSSWVLFLRNAWLDSGYMFCDSYWVLLNVFPT